MVTDEVLGAVEAALRSDGRVTSRNSIHVASNDGTITLHGVVDSLEEYGIAQEVAESVPGVRGQSSVVRARFLVNTAQCQVQDFGFNASGC